MSKAIILGYENVYKNANNTYTLECEIVLMETNGSKTVRTWAPIIVSSIDVTLTMNLNIKTQVNAFAQSKGFTPVTTCLASAFSII